MSSEFGGAAPWDDNKHYCLCGTEVEHSDSLCYLCELICPACGEDKEDVNNASCDHCTDEMNKTI